MATHRGQTGRDQIRRGRDVSSECPILGFEKSAMESSNSNVSARALSKTVARQQQALARSKALTNLYCVLLADMRDQLTHS